MTSPIQIYWTQYLSLVKEALPKGVVLSSDDYKPLLQCYIKKVSIKDAIKLIKKSKQ